MRLSDYEVVVLRPKPMWSRERDYELDGIRVHYFGTLEMPSYIFDGATDGWNARSFMHRLRSLDIEPRQIAVIHAHTINGIAYALAAKGENQDIKVVIQHHSLDPMTIRNGKLAGWRVNARYRARHALRLLNMADLHLSVSQIVQDSLLAFPKAREEETFAPYLDRLGNMVGLPSVKPKQMYVLHNGVDIEAFRPIAKSKDGIFRIGCVANLQPLKDHLTLLKALNRLVKAGGTDYHLLLIGTGETKVTCEQYIEQNELQNNVEWWPETRHQELPALFAQLDLYVMPSRFEAFGCVYTEAFACGVPYICCKHQGTAELIEPAERDRWTIEPGDDAQLALLIEHHRHNPQPQHLCDAIDIDTLMTRYLEHLRHC